MAVAGRDTAATINAKLWSTHVDAVLFTAGIYHLEDALVVTQSNFTVLGLGLATLVPTSGRAAIKVMPGLSSVRLAGVLLQASTIKSPVLLEWGAVGDYCADCFISDLFARVGGPDGTRSQPAAVDVFVHLKSSGVVGDNFWLWRADHTHHGTGTHPEENPCKTGLIVDGHDTTMYGLAVEHTLEDMTIWNGENGRTYFYQAELPYGVSESWGKKKFVGYRVASHVQRHSAHGVGVYHYFRDHHAEAETGIQVPDHLLHSFVAPIGVYLNGKGSMQHVINGRGAPTRAHGGGAMVSYTCLGMGLFPAEIPDYRAVPAVDFTPPGIREEPEETSQLQHREL